MAVGGSFGEFALFCKKQIRKIIKEQCEKCDVENFNPYRYEEGSKCKNCEHWKEMCGYRAEMFKGGYVKIFDDEE